MGQSLQARGIGEIGICGVAAAIVNAIYNATVVRVRDLPATLDCSWALQAWQKLSRHIQREQPHQSSAKGPRSISAANPSPPLSDQASFP